MAEFIGKTGTVIDIEGTRPKMYRVRLDAPVEIEGIGSVTDDLWEGRFLKAIRPRA
jgi:proline racemase